MKLILVNTDKKFINPNRPYSEGSLITRTYFLEDDDGKLWYRTEKMKLIKEGLLVDVEFYPKPKIEYINAISYEGFQYFPERNHVPMLLVDDKNKKLYFTLIEEEEYATSKENFQPVNMVSYYIFNKYEFEDGCFLDVYDIPKKQFCKEECVKNLVIRELKNVAYTLDNLLDTKNLFQEYAETDAIIKKATEEYMNIKNKSNFKFGSYLKGLLKSPT